MGKGLVCKKFTGVTDLLSIIFWLLCKLCEISACSQSLGVAGPKVLELLRKIARMIENLKGEGLFKRKCLAGHFVPPRLLFRGEQGDQLDLDATKVGICVVAGLGMAGTLDPPCSSDLLGGI